MTTETIELPADIPEGYVHQTVIRDSYAGWLWKFQSELREYGKRSELIRACDLSPWWFPPDAINRLIAENPEAREYGDEMERKAAAEAAAAEAKADAERARKRERAKELKAQRAADEELAAENGYPTGTDTPLKKMATLAKRKAAAKHPIFLRCRNRYGDAIWAVLANVEHAAGVDEVLEVSRRDGEVARQRVLKVNPAGVENGTAFVLLAVEPEWAQEKRQREDEQRAERERQRKEMEERRLESEAAHARQRAQEAREEAERDQALVDSLTTEGRITTARYELIQRVQALGDAIFVNHDRMGWLVLAPSGEVELGKEVTVHRKDGESTEVHVSSILEEATINGDRLTVCGRGIACHHYACSSPAMGLNAAGSPVCAECGA
jgi:hypothetical protein